MTPADQGAAAARREVLLRGLTTSMLTMLAKCEVAGRFDARDPNHGVPIGAKLGELAYPAVKGSVQRRRQIRKLVAAGLVHNPYGDAAYRTTDRGREVLAAAIAEEL